MFGLHFLVNFQVFLQHSLLFLSGSLYSREDCLPSTHISNFPLVLQCKDYCYSKTTAPVHRVSFLVFSVCSLAIGMVNFLAFVLSTESVLNVCARSQSIAIMEDIN